MAAPRGPPSSPIKHSIGLYCRPLPFIAAREPGTGNGVRSISRTTALSCLVLLLDPLPDFQPYTLVLTIPALFHPGFSNRSYSPALTGLRSSQSPCRIKKWRVYGSDNPLEYIGCQCYLHPGADFIDSPEGDECEDERVDKLTHKG